MKNVFALLVLVTISACQHPSVTPPSPISYTLTDQGATVSSGPVCDSSVKAPVTEGVCTNTETVDHLQCVQCAVAADCIYTKAQVLCVKSCADVACHAGHAYGK